VAPQEGTGATTAGACAPECRADAASRRAPGAARHRGQAAGTGEAGGEVGADH
jgi:hypothetical protein